MTDSRTLIQEAMRASFPAYEDRVARFYGMQEYQLGWRDEQFGPANCDPGKLLRPKLSLLTCQAVGGDPRQALPLAAAIQLVHDFSLIHDDIEDQSTTRRGRATVWTIWGLAQGINTGDGMLIVAHLALHRLAEQGVAPEVALNVLRLFDQTILEVCEGQFLDLSFEGNLGITEDDYLAMIGRKTAALIDAAAELGALVGGANAETARALGRFGRSLGLAFQIQDDILGIWGDPAVTGKPAAADLYRRKVSLPVVHALATAEERTALADLYRQEELSDADVQRALDILEQAGAREHTAAVGARYHAEALAALEAVKGGETAAMAELHGLAQGLVGRKS
ncbi:MAG TPA: polyprenyl synthetase family protein [Roseiflexaceae bacterium]|nr:polyprenyl synthetase family protein [Roseiflexaceae bacterium]